MSKIRNPLKRRRRHVIVALTLLLFVGLSGGTECRAADGLPAPKGPAILVVSGNVEWPNQDGTAAFDRAMIEALGSRKLRTSTVWTKGVREFEGVLMRDILAAAGAKGSEVRAVALNDYSTTIPVSDFTRFDVIVAFRMDGVDLKPRDKGPLWIVYPRDQNRELRDAVIDSRWVWQLKLLEVK